MIKKPAAPELELERIALVGKTEEEIKKCEIEENLSELDRAKLLLSKKNQTQQIAVFFYCPPTNPGFAKFAHTVSRPYNQSSFISENTCTFQGRLWASPKNH